MKTNYIFLKTDYSNGFPYPSFEVCESFDDANKLYHDNLVTDGSMHEETPSMPISGADFTLRIFYSENNDKGNGMFLGIITEQNMIKAIQHKVDVSPETAEFRHIYDDGRETTMMCKCWCFSGIGIVEDGENRYKLDSIVKRPEDIEDETNDEFIYDVRIMNQNDDGREDSFVDSLECVSHKALVEIFNEMYL